MVSYPTDVLNDLIDGKLPWSQVRSMMSNEKDADRFTQIIAVHQSRVPWDERILLPLGEHLFVVERGGERIVKCSCGHEFGDYRENWKLHALIYVRETTEAFSELYPMTDADGLPDPDVCQIREFYCPNCAAQLEVEAVPPTYPITFDFLPDIDGLYEWVGVELDSSGEMEDRTAEVTRRWSENAPKG